MNDDNKNNNVRSYELNGDACISSFPNSKRVRFKGAYADTTLSNSGPSIALVDSDHHSPATTNVGANESVLLSSSSSTSFISNLNKSASTGTLLSIDALVGINTRTPSHALNVVQVAASTAPIVRFSLAAGAPTPHALTIDELGTCTLYGNATVTGNLTMQIGSTATVPNLDVIDPFMELNSGFLGTPTLDSGIIINRGSSADQVFMWRESDDSCVIGPYGSASVQKVATRQDTPTSNAIMTWNDTPQRCDNYTNLTFTGSRLGITSTTSAASPSASVHVINDSVSDHALYVSTANSSMQINNLGVTTFGNTTEATSTTGAVLLHGGLGVYGIECAGDYNQVGGMIMANASIYGKNAIISANGSNSDLHLVTSETGKVSITCGGTPLAIEANAALLHVQYSGSESGIDCFRVDDAATTDSSCFHISQDGRVGINGPSPAVSYIGGLRTPVLSVTGTVANADLVHESYAFFGNHVSDPNALGNLSFSGGRMTVTPGGPVDTTNRKTGAFIGANTDYALFNGAMTYSGPDNDGTDKVMCIELASEFGRINMSGFKGAPYSAGATEYQVGSKRAIHVSNGVFINGSVATPFAEGLCTVDGGVGFGAGITDGGRGFLGPRVQFLSTTPSTSPTTGALVITGGLGVGRSSGSTFHDMYVGAINVTGTTTGANMIISGGVRLSIMTSASSSVDLSSLGITSVFLLMSATGVKTVTLPLPNIIEGRYICLLDTSGDALSTITVSGGTIRGSTVATGAYASSKYIARKSINTWNRTMTPF